MQAYPKEYAEHNLPLVFLSGLGERSERDQARTSPPWRDSGTRIATASAECSGDRANQLVDQLLGRDGSEQPWNSQALPGPSSTLKYRMRLIGRTFTLPPRKAAPLSQSPGAEGFSTAQASTHRTTELYSPLSPLSPGSPIYPDGVFTPRWFAKHQQQVPALLIAFFEISADEEGSQNERIQIDINAIRSALGRSGFKTRFAAVLMSDRSILRAPELEDRLTAIRRATTLDMKTGLFFMPPMSSPAEIATFVQSMLTALQPLALEYYRELTKHSRRKKARGGPAGSVTSPVEGGAHALSTPGWNVRYEVKQGVFAEFRQEMDVAERHYSVAIEELFSSEGILEATPSWSPRWDEARLLCDIVALRVLRCELWSDLTSSAVVSWTNHKARTRDLIDRRGKGSQTYAWDAWETRWAEIMAQLIQRAVVRSLQPSAKRAIDDSMELNDPPRYAAPEKPLAASDSLPPFHLLHHPGYWLRLAIGSARARRAKALAIPEEERTAPGHLPASAVAHRANTYDTFLVPDPHEEYPLAPQGAYDHIADFIRLTDEAIREFALRSEGRAIDRLNLDLAHELAAAGRFTSALERLLPIWDECTWRDDEWDDLLASLLTLLHECAMQAGDAEVHVVTAWELLGLRSASSPIGNDALSEHVRRSWPKSQKIVVRFENRQRLSPLSARFVFGNSETHVGERIDCQLTLTSHAARDFPTLAPAKVAIVLGNAKTITITHLRGREQLPDRDMLFDLSDVVESVDGSLSLDADLSLPHAKKRTYSFCLSFREAGVLRLRQLSLHLGDEHYTVEHTLWDDNLVRGASLYVQDGDVLDEQPLPYAETTAVVVLPKPPKMQIVLHGLRKQYYLGETIKLSVELTNDEAEGVDVTAAAFAACDGERSVSVRWHDSEMGSRELDIGRLGVSATHSASLHITTPSEPAVSTLTVEVRYTLLSESGTPLSKTLGVDISVMAPFEAKYSFGPLLHPDPWPSYFAPHATATYGQSEGIPQRWRLGSLLHSSAADALLVRALRLAKAVDTHDKECLVEDPPPFAEQTLDPDHDLRTESAFVTRKLSFDDRRPTNVEFSLQVDWSRDDASDIMTTILDVPRLNLPSSEPRVLCTMANKESDERDITLQYHIENPSAHFLTFALTMEANEDFAFSGAKFRTLSVTPISRVRVEYRLLVHDAGDESTDATGKGRWIRPVLQVVDSYYNKALRIHSGGPGVRIYEKGNLSVLVAKPLE